MAREHIPLESGVVLVAPPNLIDPNFKRSVVLLCEHTAAGSFGLILNHDVTVAMSELAEDLARYSDPVRVGGPVQLDTLHFVHRLGGQVSGALELFDGVFWGGEIDELHRLLDEREPKHDELRFFLGYAGWGEGQLEDEVNEGGWILLRPSVDLVFPQDPTRLWRNAMIRLGGEYALLANFPENPIVN